jgi:hypothetical protein
LQTIDAWDGDDGEELEAEIMRADRPFGADLRGTTACEALAGDSLDQGLAQELPERPPVDESLPSATTASRTSRASSSRKARLRRTGSRLPEEAALSVRYEAPGATDHDDPHPVDDA